MLSDDFDIELEEESLGDIVISLERAFEQSKEYNQFICAFKNQLFTSIFLIFPLSAQLI